MKMNTDGAAKGNPGAAGSGGVIRDFCGQWITGFAAKIGIATAIEAELWGLFYGLHLAWQKGIRKLIVELDSSVAIAVLHTQVKPEQTIFSLVMSCRNLLALDWAVKLQHVYREANSAADRLANEGCILSSGVVFWDIPPDFLVSTLWNDCKGVTSSRVKTMDSFDHDFIESSPEKVDHSVHNLLEEGWFFGKVLKPRMLRWYSDPSPRIAPEILASPSSNQEISSAKNVPKRLLRTPSLPPFLGREVRARDDEGKGSCKQVNKLSSQLSIDQTLVRKLTKSSRAEKKGMETKERTRDAGQSTRRNTLVRTPSLPQCIGREEDEDTDGDEISMSRLIRQAMPKTSDLLPPRHASNKCMMQISSMPPRNSEPESTNTARSNHRKYQQQNRRTLKKSLSNITEFKHVLNDRNIQNDSNFTTTNTQHNHQERHRNNQYVNKTIRPCIPEACHAQSSAPPAPIRNSKDSAQHMKAQFKFWARAVASNVR